MTSRSNEDLSGDAWRNLENNYGQSDEEEREMASPELGYEMEMLSNTNEISTATGRQDVEPKEASVVSDDTRTQEYQPLDDCEMETVPRTPGREPAIVDGHPNSSDSENDLDEGAEPVSGSESSDDDEPEEKRARVEDDPSQSTSRKIVLSQSRVNRLLDFLEMLVKEQAQQRDPEHNDDQQQINTSEHRSDEYVIECFIVSADTEVR